MLASAEVITGMVVLAWLSGVLGVAGLAFTAFGLWAPHAVHLLADADAEHHAARLR